MPTFEQGDLVKVPFPYTDRPTRQSRPALVVADGKGDDALGLLWVVMVTSAENRGWPGDIVLAELADTGLPAPSVIRTAKIATIDARDATPLGKVSDGVRAQALAQIAVRLGWSA
jgi:mRNA interferase MazF